ncbi:MAG: hypothetical protein K6G89_08935 [Clostridia bacterium]|nr:hypothetical protein [Clostridia bacterium]
MKDLKMFNAISNLNEDQVEGFSADKYEETQKNMKKTHFKTKVIIAVVCTLSVLLAAVITAIGVFSETKEYNTAISFFEANGLSSEGLSRSDIKVVYKDIETSSFSNSLTSQVFKNSISGLEIEVSELTKEEMAEIWNNLTQRSTAVRSGDYVFEKELIYDQNDELEKSVVRCLLNGELVWETEIKDFSVSGCSYTVQGTIVWGYTDSDNAYGSRLYAWTACIDGNGAIKWKHMMIHHMFKNEFVVSAMSNGDGTWAVVSRADKNYICVTYLDSNGKETNSYKNDIGVYNISKAVRFGDGFMVKGTDTLYKLDREGNLTESLSYRINGLFYKITDMIEYNGNVYVSAYCYPENEDNNHGNRYELQNIIEYIYVDPENIKWDIGSDELVPMFRDNYTAALLKCDRVTGQPSTFYSVPGAFGGGLYVNGEGLLEWNVENIASVRYSPTTSAFSFAGAASVYKYYFDLEGNMTSFRDTGEIQLFFK